ncbi:hypothetical protein D3C80_1430440 [compost metagenome]
MTRTCKLVEHVVITDYKQAWVNLEYGLIALQATRIHACKLHLRLDPGGAFPMQQQVVTHLNTRIGRYANSDAIGELARVKRCAREAVDAGFRQQLDRAWLPCHRHLLHR